MKEFYKQNGTVLITGGCIWKVLLCVQLTLIASLASGLDFRYNKMPGSAEGTITPIPGGFRLSMKKTPNSKGFVESYAAINNPITNDQVLYFKWRGAENNQKTIIGIFLSVFNRETGKSEFKIHRLGSADGTEWRVAVLRFDKCFGIKNDSYDAVNLRFVLNGENNPNEDSSIEIVDFAVIGETEAKQKISSQNDQSSQTVSGTNGTIKFARGYGLPDQAKGNVENIPGGFRMTMENTPDSKGIIEAGSVGFKKTVTAEQRLQFRFRGAPDNNLTTFGVMFSFKDLSNGKSLFKVHRVGTADGPEWRKVKISFDQNLHLPAGSYEISSIRFVLNGKDNSKHSSSVDITDIEIVDQKSSPLESGDFVVIPGKQSKEQEAFVNAVNIRPVKVFFDFDNNDFQLAITKRNQKTIYEKTPSAGFRDLLLKNCANIIERVDSPSNANVIVYSRASTSPHIKDIIDATKRGAGLLVYGIVPDAELLPLLPAEIDVKTIKELAVRKTVKQSDLPLFNGEKFNDVDFGCYIDLHPRGGSRNVLSYSDGKPFAVGNEKILLFGAGVGTTLLNSNVFYDKLLLHCIMWYGSDNPTNAVKALKKYEIAVASQLDQEERMFVESVAEAANIPKSERSKYFRGMSHNNFGRFGYDVAEGLSCDNIDLSLKVVDAAKRIQGYMFDVTGKKSIPLKVWKVKVISGTVQFPHENPATLDSGEIWRGVGKVEYRYQLEMRSEWKGENLFFVVKDGISDCDESYFNGQLIGSVNNSATEYWSRPRRYAIPEKLIKWGEINEFRVVIENLHHGACFNSRPELVIAGNANTRQLAVTGINWIYKQYEIITGNEHHRMSFNVVTPFILYDFPQKIASMTVENIAEYAAFSNADGIKIINLMKDNLLYDVKRDGKLAAPWILLFRNGKTSPLLLALSRNINSIKAETSRNEVERLVFCGDEGLGEIVVGRPWGITNVDTFGWEKSLPADVKKKINMSLDYALNIPVACDEIYQVDRSNKLVKITNRFRFHRVKDEWNTPVSSYAILPPVTAFSIKNKIIGSSADTLVDFDMNTKFGPVLGVKGRDTVNYSLPLPENYDPFLPQIATINDKLVEDIQKYTLAGCQWSFGSKILDFFTPAEPLGAGFPSLNIDPFAWQMGMGPLLDGYFQYNNEVRVITNERIRKRVLEPMELYRHKNFDAERVEPFSGIRYTTNFRCFTHNSVNYVPYFGSKIIFADANEVHAQTAWIAVMLADRFGYARYIRNSWPHYEYLASYNMVLDDWAFHSGGCREYGVGGFADMLNCEFPGMFYHARLAEIAGDQRGADNAIYRAAKKSVPTIARWHFDSYIYANNLVSHDKKIARISGFSENDGGKHELSPLKQDRYILDAVYMFDFSQGFPGCMYHLYNQYCKRKVQEYIKEALPTLIDKNGKFASMRYLVMLAQFCGDNIPLEKFAVEVLNVRDTKLRSDRGGFHTGYELGNVLAWKYQVPRVQTAHDLTLYKCSFNVENRQLTLVFNANSTGAKMIIPIPTRLASKDMEIPKSKWTLINEGLALPVLKGANYFMAQY